MNAFGLPEKPPLIDWNAGDKIISRGKVFEKCDPWIKHKMLLIMKCYLWHSHCLTNKICMLKCVSFFFLTILNQAALVYESFEFWWN